MPAAAASALLLLPAVCGGGCSLSIRNANLIGLLRVEPNEDDGLSRIYCDCVAQTMHVPRRQQRHGNYHLFNLLSRYVGCILQHQTLLVSILPLVLRCHDAYRSSQVDTLLMTNEPRSYSGCEKDYINLRNLVTSCSI